MKSGYMCTDVYMRVKNEIEKQGMKLSPACTEMGLSKNAIANFRVSMPKADTLAMIADFLDVSVDYLLGRHQAVTAVAPADDVSRLVAIYKKLSPEKQEFLMKQAEMYLDAENDKKVANSDLV